MPNLLRDARATARKSNRCDCCGVEIPAGTVYVRETYVDDNRVYDWKVCDPCDAVSATVWRWVDRLSDEGIDRDDYIEWASEHRDHPQHGEAARALLSRAGIPLDGGGS